MERDTHWVFVGELVIDMGYDIIYADPPWPQTKGGQGVLALTRNESWIIPRCQWANALP